MAEHLCEAWQNRQVALAWKLARLLSGRSIGPRLKRSWQHILWHIISELVYSAVGAFVPENPWVQMLGHTLALLGHEDHAAIRKLDWLVLLTC